MGLKKFIKPTKGKIILYLILLIAPIVNLLTGINISTKITNFLFFPAKYFYTQGFRMGGDLGLSPATYWVIISIIFG